MIALASIQYQSTSDNTLTGFTIKNRILTKS